MKSLIFCFRHEVLCEYMRYSKEEDKFLIDNYQKLPTEKNCKILNRSNQSIRYRASVLGISKNYFFSKEEDDILIMYFGKIPTKDISKIINRKPMAIRDRAYKLGISLHKRTLLSE